MDSEDGQVFIKVGVEMEATSGKQEQGLMEYSPRIYHTLSAHMSERLRMRCSCSVPNMAPSRRSVKWRPRPPRRSRSV